MLLSQYNKTVHHDLTMLLQPTPKPWLNVEKVLVVKLVTIQVVVAGKVALKA